MKNLLAGVGILTAIFLIGAIWINSKGARQKPIETMKALVWFCLVNGCGWVWSSYVLAYLGREEIAESLSKVALTEIVVVVFTYAAKALVEQLSKNNKWPDKPSEQKEDNNV